MSNSQLNKLKFGIKTNTEVILKISSNIIGDSNDESNFPHKLLLTNTQITKLCKAFANIFSANIKLAKTQLHKIGQSRGFLCRLLRPLLKNGLPLIVNVLKPLPKSVLIWLIAAEAVAATDAAIHKKMLGSDTRPSDLAKQRTSIISNEEMNDITKIVKYL